MSDTLINKRVLVTAGAGGAGLGIANRFRQVGARVAVCDIDAAAVAAARVDGLHAEVADVSSESDVNYVFDAAESALGGPVEVLINNVGIGGPTAAVEDVSLEDWTACMAVNVTGHFLCIKRAVPAMKAAGTGLIVNISSGSAKVGLPLRAPYVVSKGAVLSLTMTLARELGPHGVRVNAILPGAIEGERVKRIIREKAEELGRDPVDHERDLLRYISLRTMVSPEDIADMTIFLASDAGARISGQMIGVDGNVEWEE